MTQHNIIRLMDIQDTMPQADDKDLELLYSAYVFAANKHKGQLRKSGEPYLSHPLNVAKILAEMKMDMDTVIAGLLHDTLEDTDATYDELDRLFGKDVAFLVDGVSKIGRIRFQSKEEKQAENFRKMLISVSKDIRVIVIKLADRLHNMRTIKHLDDKKRKRIALETLEIYAPLAHRLGIAWIKWELEDASFKELEPEKYYEIQNKVKLKRSDREQYLKMVKELIEKHIEAQGLKFEVFGRPKHFYSIYDKMVRKKTSFDEIYDLIALRVLVEKLADCYAVLGIIHSLWTPITGRFKDFVAMPKSNMYQSLHTTVVGPNGLRVEFQIRTYSMNLVAEEGIAAHWKYKENQTFDPKIDRVFVWLRQLLDQQGLNKPLDFVKALKDDILPVQIYVFTPRGDIIELPTGSTPLDFAYAIHTEVGHSCIGAKIDGRMVPLRYRLKDGEKVDIVNSLTQTPKRDWLNIVKTNRAKIRIRSYLRKKETDTAIEQGLKILEREFQLNSVKFKDILADKKNIKEIESKFSLNGVEDIYKNVGFGIISAKQILHLFVKQEAILKSKEIVKPKENHYGPFIIEGIEGILVKAAKCCNPLPGDSIAGYVSRGRGVIVHKRDCKNFDLISVSKERIIEVKWDESKKFGIYVDILCISDNKQGILRDITNAIKESGINIVELNAQNIDAATAKQVIKIEIMDKNQLNYLMSKIKNIPGIQRVNVA